MEFFERAHVTKGKNSTRKDNKADEKVKRQLKQMLYGYQHSDIIMIKDSAQDKTDIDDSSSVSGYSDLNLTNSSYEGDTTQGTLSSGRNDDQSSEKNDISLDDSQNISVTEAAGDSLSNESISEYDEAVNSLSEDVCHVRPNTQLSGDSDESLSDSFIETLTDIESDSYDEFEFDPDGSLAAKIIEKINKKETKKEKKSLKRKLVPTVSDADKEPALKSEYKGPYKPNKEDVTIDNLSAGMSNINLPQTNRFRGPYRPKDDRSSEDSTIVDDNVSQTLSLPDSVDLSLPFVSVNAEDMPGESLSDIIGEYRHPTVRSLPSSENQTDNLGLFETENVSIVDIRADEEVGSLIPEIDNVSVDDIDLDSLDSSKIEAVTIDESIADDVIPETVEGGTSYDTLETEDTSEKEQSIDCVDNKLQSVKIYYGRNNSCIFVLKHPKEIYIHGKVKVKKLGGEIEILGYIPKDDPVNVYAPNYNYAQYIRTLENQNTYYGLFGKLTSSGLTVAEAEDIVISLGENDSVVLMQQLKTRQMEFVEENFTITDLFSKLNKSIDSSLRKASEILGCSLYTAKPWKSFEKSVVWKQSIECGLNPQSRGIICGGKGTGKSTFLRYYVNKLLASGPLLVVDLDPGQCEFTPAGNVSATVVTEPLLGPNFTHLKTPEMMLYMGMINTMDNPRRYAAAVEALIAYCHNDEKLRNLPWIVNTMGMTNTMGLKFMSLIILHTQPTFLLQIDSKNFKKRYDFHLYPQTIKNLYFEDYQNDILFKNVKEVDLDYSFFLSHHNDSVIKNSFSLAPREERYLNFLSYFGEMLNTRSGNLLGVVPYEVSLKDLKIGLNVKIDAEAVTKVLNGKIVALCQHQGDSGAVFTLENTPLPCLAMGLIRGVDWEKGLLYVITPAAGERLAAADTLVYADWTPELRGCSGLPPGQSLPYRTAAHYHQRQFMFAPKRRFNPLQLLKMSRNS